MKLIVRYFPGFVVGVIGAQLTIWSCKKAEVVTPPKESVATVEATVQPTAQPSEPLTTPTPTPTPTPTTQP